MEDHSVFYSRSLSNYPNYCARVHFFSGQPNDVEARLRAIAANARGLPVSEYRARCAEFCSKHYIGFCVVKPLHGTPVGRTVLKTFPRHPRDKDGSDIVEVERHFDPTHLYRSHLLGVELSVTGLAFQQQDVGVAACATTAVWTALQQFRELEEIGTMTPAHITSRATHGRLPFGRSMPSEGLSVDQMCQAIQAFNVSPALSTVVDFSAARAHLYSACRSRMATVLVISDETETRHHAIVAVGMKLGPVEVPSGQLHSRGDDRLIALYVHDDRFGPYLRADLVKEDSQLVLSIRTRKGIDGASDETERWRVTHILTPMHHKIRLSFAELQQLATPLVKSIGQTWNQATRKQGEKEQPAIEYRVWVARSHSYLERLAVEEAEFDSNAAATVAERVPLSRYIGVLQISVREIGVLHVLIDSTGTRRNPAYSAVVCSATSNTTFRQIAVALSSYLRCPIF
jgi:hypothetical protein